LKLAKRLSEGGRRLSFCYEAGPCGYGLHRLLSRCGHDCVVVAPSLIPTKAGDRVKTDRRDARMLAKLHRAGELTPIWVPDAAHEAMRDLVRARGHGQLRRVPKYPTHNPLHAFQHQEWIISPRCQGRCFSADC
jgi:transposase